MPRVVSYLPQELFEKRKVEIPSGWDFIFAKDFGEKEIIEACKEADFLLVTAANPPINASIIQNIHSVRFLQVFGAGFDKIDIDAARELNLPVANTPGQNATTVAEFTIGVLVALQRKMIIGNREVKAGNHASIEREFITTGLKEIRGTKIGLLGLGAIGRLVAGLAVFMGAEVSYYDPYRLDKSMEEELKVIYCSFQELLENSEVISLHLPLNKDTRGLISRDELALMQPGALLINTARGEIVDQSALAEALESGHLGGAAVDHFSPDPPPVDHPLLALSAAASDRLIVSSHIAGVTAGSFRRMLIEAVGNLQRVAAGENPKYVVNGITQARIPKEGGI
ncbi:MAG: NAD(P)-dependent oxidoreductase [Bacillota bacterium]|nr:NAD(P)-dependent oxidoreductase [Bacillota bacterium]